MLIVGPPTSGKTRWLTRLLAEIEPMHSTPIQQILFCYDKYQPEYDAMRNACPKPITFVQGVPYETIDEIEQKGTRQHQTLLILDDLMMKSDLSRLAQIFTNGRHSGINVIMVLHNLTHRGKTGAEQAAMVDMNRNCRYRIIFCLPSNVQNIRTLQTQMFPFAPGFLMGAYQDACCSKPYGYMVLDSAPSSDNNARVYTKVWPDEETEFYLPINSTADSMRIPGGAEINIDRSV